MRLRYDYAGEYGVREDHKLVQKLSATASKQFLLRAYVFI